MNAPSADNSTRRDRPVVSPDPQDRILRGPSPLYTSARDSDPPWEASTQSNPRPVLRPRPWYRVWRDRWFLLSQSALLRRSPHPTASIHFAGWPEVETMLRRSFRFTRHQLTFGPIGQLDHQPDVVVPLTPEASIAAAQRRNIRRQNPLPLPAPRVIDLCHDKGACQEALHAAGLRAYLPAPATLGRFPYMVKRRWGGNAQHAHRIENVEQENQMAEVIASSDYLVQQWVHGPEEFAAHILFIGGRIRRVLTCRYGLPDSTAVLSQSPVREFGRCPSRHHSVFTKALRALEFEGLCCIDYREVNGRPVILEVNPRMGYSLIPYFFSFVRDLDWGLAGVES